MKQSNLQHSASAGHLSVVHKPVGINPVPYYEYDTILQTDLDFNITGWNIFSRELNGQEMAIGKNLFDLVDIGFIDGNFEDFHQHLLVNGFWKGEMSLRNPGGETIYYRTTAAHIVNDRGAPNSIMLVGENITEIKRKELELREEEKKYEILLNSLPEGFMIINTGGEIENCNKIGADILGYAEEQLIGKKLDALQLSARDEEGKRIEFDATPGMVSLQTGLSQRDVIMQIKRPDGKIIWLSVNAEALVHDGEVRPYAAVTYYADITGLREADEEIRKTHELVNTVTKLTQESDATWEFDPVTKAVTRSEGIFKLSGYTPEQMQGNMNWWLSKVHPEDRERVKKSMHDAIQNGVEQWEEQYWFECADGTYKFLSDYAVIVKKDGMPVREIGAVKDMTELKNLEAQLMEEQLKRKKEIAEATVQGQEYEKINISRELHDNVNQILMSAKLFMEMAVKRPDETYELIDKAIEYQMMALQEIRKLSHSMNSANIKRFRLKKSVGNIVENMKLLKGLNVKFSCGRQVENKLTDDQKLMLFRVIQEQTNNIIKYAQGARSVQIKISDVDNFIHMLIIDDGKGFDVTTINEKGIGFINIRSRAEAHNGEVNIISAPEKGCTLELLFPI